MLSETERESLSDILFNIDLAQSFAQGVDYEGFLADIRTFYAIMRCLEIISEASRRLSPETKARHPAIPWREMSASVQRGQNNTSPTFVGESNPRLRRRFFCAASRSTPRCLLCPQ